MRGLRIEASWTQSQSVLSDSSQQEKQERKKGSLSWIGRSWQTRSPVVSCAEWKSSRVEAGPVLHAGIPNKYCGVPSACVCI